MGKCDNCEDLKKQLLEKMIVGWINPDGSFKPSNHFQSMLDSRECSTGSKSPDIEEDKRVRILRNWTIIAAVLIAIEIARFLGFWHLYKIN